LDLGDDAGCDAGLVGNGLLVRHLANTRESEREPPKSSGPSGTDFELLQIVAGHLAYEVLQRLAVRHRFGEQLERLDVGLVFSIERASSEPPGGIRIEVLQAHSGPDDLQPVHEWPNVDWPDRNASASPRLQSWVERADAEAAL